ncbi:Mitotic spindle checkpoint protein [Actinidia chinensis var. chinensis]|uniref:Mitotic spindle checkpoint protein n=1 Tax=Actinidia chinensis var. chinensis TaxID=1590841 RepID=A0A2R6RFH7_ACTCC|nr:Mitotic spindle checkpoint protein [Actinidia chinensis var. chinensis]
MASSIATKDIITLRGSAAIVSEFFGYAANSILYNRGVYPEENFAKVKKYGLPMLLTQDKPSLPISPLSFPSGWNLESYIS